MPGDQTMATTPTRVRPSFRGALEDFGAMCMQWLAGPVPQAVCDGNGQVAISRADSDNSDTTRSLRTQHAQQLQPTPASSCTCNSPEIAVRQSWGQRHPVDKGFNKVKVESTTSELLHTHDLRATSTKFRESLSKY